METKILNIENPVDGIIIQRLNRFVVKIQIKGQAYRAYINNTGRLEQLLVRDRKAFCVANEQRGKTDYRLFAVEEGKLGALIDTQWQMKAFEKSLEKNLLPWLKGAKILKRNPKLGNSVIDYLLECDQRQIYLEVKSAVLRDELYAMYPDCPSLRGSRHVEELTNCVRNGGEATILFIAALPGVKAFKPNQPAHPELYQSLLKAHQAGVKLKSIGMFYHPQDSAVYLFSPDLTVNL